MAQSNNPYELNISNVYLQKFNGTDRISILGQVGKFDLYQSLFAPCMKASLDISDSIDLFTNYPLTGEERVIIEYTQLEITNEEGRPSVLGSPTRSNPKQVEFVITDIMNIEVAANSRLKTYTIVLASEEYFESARKKLAIAYQGIISETAEDIYNEHIKKDITRRKATTNSTANKTITIEETSKAKTLVIPNLHPLDSINWLTKYAISAEDDKHVSYCFFENMNGFHFVSLQKIIKEARERYIDLLRNRFFVVSNIENARAISTVDSNLEKNIYFRLATNLKTNKRLSTQEKLAGGYFQNEYVEINLLQKSYNVTKVELDPNENFNNISLEKYAMNTPEYIEMARENTDERKETIPKIRYFINNTQLGEYNDYRKKFGLSTQYFLALNQVDIHMVVPPDFNLNIGEVIYVEFFNNSGFSDAGTDKYLSCLFMITELRHTMIPGAIGSTTLRLNKDAYLSELDKQMRYGNSNNTQRQIVRDPATGRAIGPV